MCLLMHAVYVYLLLRFARTVRKCEMLCVESVISVVEWKELDLFKSSWFCYLNAYGWTMYFFLYVILF